MVVLQYLHGNISSNNLLLGGVVRMQKPEIVECNLAICITAKATAVAAGKVSALVIATCGAIASAVA